MFFAISSFKCVCVCTRPQISLIVACITGVIAYRLAVYAAFASIIKDPKRKIQVVSRFITPQLATSVTASCINFVIIMILNFFYERVAVWITDMGKKIESNVQQIKVLFRRQSNLVCFSHHQIFKNTPSELLFATPDLCALTLTNYLHGLPW